MEAGGYSSENSRTFWAMLDGERVGLVEFEYLREISPTVGFRVRTPHRGRGIGGRMVRWAAGHFFRTRPDKHRLEGDTRTDNAAMCHLFEKCGWTREAHYHRSWPAGDGTYLDSFGYAILREDWVRFSVGS